MYQDAENYMTPNRLKVLQRRAAANAAMKERLRRAAEAKAHGVLPATDPGHVVEEGVTLDDFLAGILFADGTVHIFDRAAQQHSEYARSVGRPNVDCGCAYGDDGWGFYLNEPSQTLQGYMVPEQFQPALAEVCKALLANVGRRHDSYVCAGCGERAVGNGCRYCNMSRSDSAWQDEQNAQRVSVPISYDDSDYDEVPALSPAQRAARKAQASRTPEQRRQAALKAAETRRRNKAARDRAGRY